MKLKTRPVVSLFIALPLLVLAGSLCWLFEGGRLAVALAKHRARAAGMPTTMEEVLPPHVPDADNAAPVIARLAPQLFRALQSPNLKGEGDLIIVIYRDQEIRRNIRSFPPYGGLNDWGSKDDDEWRTANLKHEKTLMAWLTTQLDSPPLLAALAVIHEAAAKPGYDARVAYLPGTQPHWPNDGDYLRKYAALLSGYAMLAADRGQTEDACAQVWAMLQLADFMANEPVISRQNIRIRIWDMAIANLEELAATGKLPPAWNRKFAGRLAAMNPVGDLARYVSAASIIGGEIWFGGMLTGKINYNTISPETGFYIIPGNIDDQIWYRFHGVVRREYAEYIDWYRQVRAAITEPGISPLELSQRLQDADASIKPNRKMLRKLLTDPPLYRASIDDMIIMTWSLRVKLAVTQVGLALERYRAEKGEYPPMLSALAPEYLSAVPADVTTGRPLHYHRVPDGATVFGNGGYGDMNERWTTGKEAE
jgi:hypothetical protein